MREMHHAVLRVPDVEWVVGALRQDLCAETDWHRQQKLGLRHVRRDVLLIKRDHSIDVVFSKADPVLRSLGGQNYFGDLEIRLITVDVPFAIFVLWSER